MIQSNYPITYPTVDVAVMHVMTSEVLLGRKSTEALWRFPGGFVDFTDVSWEMAAARELREETGLVANPDHLSYCGSTVIDDPRYRGDGSRRIISSLFTVSTSSTNASSATGLPRAMDDLAEVRFFPFATFDQHLVPEHAPLGKLLARYR